MIDLDNDTAVILAITIIGLVASVLGGTVAFTLDAWAYRRKVRREIAAGRRWQPPRATRFCLHCRVFAGDRHQDWCESLRPGDQPAEPVEEAGRYPS